MKPRRDIVYIVFLILLMACTPLLTTNHDEGAESGNPNDFAETTRSIQITDALERTVTLEKAPERIVITGKALIMILNAAYVFPEANDRIIAFGNATQGSTNFINLVDPSYHAKAILEHSAGPEQIASVKPELVILKSSLAQTYEEPLEELGIPVIFVDLETPEQYFRDLMILGKIFQNKARAQQIINYYQAQVEKVNLGLSGNEEKPRTLLLYYTDKDGVAAFSVPPVSWMQTRLVEMAGGDPVWTSANPGRGWAKVSLEQIASWDADQILVVSYSQTPSTIISTLQTDPQWQSIRAVKENHLVAFPGDFYSWDQPDVRWILGLTWLAGRLHPGQFPDLDMAREVQNFYQQVYGIDQDFFNQNILQNVRDLP